MTFTVTYRGADGAMREEAAIWLRPCRWASDFLHFDIAEDIVAEFPWATEELLFGSGQRDIGAKLKFDKVQGADEVCKLKKAIAGRSYLFSKLHMAAYCVFKNLMKHSRNWSLSAIIVDFDPLERGEEFAILQDEIVEIRFKAGNDLLRGVYELLVHAETMIPIFNLARKCHHARENASTKLAAQHGVVLLASDERAGMETVTLKANFAVGALKEGDSFGYVNGLVVEHHADNVETGFSVGDVEVSRFVHEYAQRFCFHSVPSQKREWRDTNPATHAESFPRIPVTPSRRKKSPRIVANRGCGCNGGIAEFFSCELFRRAA